MTALAENRTDDAKALIHPEAVEKSDASIAQLERYLSDRTTSTIEQKTINVSTSTGTPGKIQQEQVSYQATLSDGETVYLKVVYYSDHSGTGFLSFQMILGIV